MYISPMNYLSPSSQFVLYTAHQDLCLTSGKPLLLQCGHHLIRVEIMCLIRLSLLFDAALLVFLLLILYFAE